MTPEQQRYEFELAMRGGARDRVFKPVGPAPDQARNVDMLKRILAEKRRKAPVATGQPYGGGHIGRPRGVPQLPIDRIFRTR